MLRPPWEARSPGEAALTTRRQCCVKAAPTRRAPDARRRHARQTGLRPASQLARLERVAARHGAGLQSVREPASPLRRRAMSEAVGDNVALALPLQAVVADSSRGLQRRLNVAGLNELPFR